ncbi:MAG: SixA phosphatase family protein [Candidatus Dormibacteria bacterium]
MRSLYLIRHAIAEERDAWRHPDHLRPLSQAGWRQAAALADLLAEAGIEAHHSSPSTRCRDTLLPLAHAGALAVIDDLRFAEGSASELDEGALRGLLGELMADGRRRVCACSHGDVIPQWLAAAGVRSGGRCPKGGVWRLDLPDGKPKVTQAVYLGRPDPAGGWDPR